MSSLGIFALPSFPLDTIDFYVAVLLISCVVLMGFGNVLNIPLMGRSQGFMTYSKFAQDQAGEAGNECGVEKDMNWR